MAQKLTNRCQVPFRAVFVSVEPERLSFDVQFPRSDGWLNACEPRSSGGLLILSNQVANEPEKDMSIAENSGFFIPSYTCQIVWHSLFDRNVEKWCPHAALWFPS